MWNIPMIMNFTTKLGMMPVNINGCALGHKDPPEQLHANPPSLEIAPALMNSNWRTRVSAREPWQGIIHLVRSLARFYSFQPYIIDALSAMLASPVAVRIFGQKFSLWGGCAPPTSPAFLYSF